MSTSTLNKTEVGLGDTYENLIIGEGLSQLKSVDDLPDDVEPGTGDQTQKPEASTESFEVNLHTESVKAECPQHGEGGGVPRPAVSRVIDAEGHARITILFGYVERFHHLGFITGLIDAATENDVVDLTIASRPGAKEGTIEMRSMLSAIDRCQAHVITRAGALTTFGEVALWLSGDERRMSKMGCVMVRQPAAGYVGDIADYEHHLKAVKQSLKEYTDYIAATGLFTKEELKTAIEKRSILHLSYDELFERIKTLKNVD